MDEVIEAYKKHVDSGMRTAWTLVLLVAGASACLAADATLDRIAADAPGPDRYPDADALVLREVRTITLDAEGRKTERTHRLVKVLTPLGIKAYAEQRFPFDEARQGFEVATARTRMRDGTIVETPEHGINVVTPDAASRAPAYASLREGVVSLLGIEPGALLELEVVVEDVEGVGSSAGGIEVFAAEHPVLEKTLIVDLPKSAPFSGRTLGSEGFERSEDGSQRRWTLRNIPAFPGEPEAPPLETCAPAVLYAAGNATGERLERFFAAFRTAASGDLPASLRGALEALKKGHDTTVPRILAVESLVAGRVRAVEAAWDAFAPRAAGAVWREGYGNGTDLGVLLSACLSFLGVEHRPALVSPLALESLAGIPCASAFAEVRLLAGPGGAWWIDPFRPGRETGLMPPARGFVAVASGAGGVSVERVEPGGPKGRLADLRGTLDLAADGSGTLHLEAELRGPWNPFFRNEGRGGVRNALLEALRRAFGEAEIHHLLVAVFGPDKTAATVAARLPRAWVTDGDLGRFQIEGSFFLEGTAPIASTRTRAFRLPSPRLQTVELWVHPPPGWSEAATPVPFSKGIEGKLRASVLGWAREGPVMLFRSMEIAGGDVAGGDLEGLREILGVLASPASRTVLFKKVAEGE